MCRSLIFSRLAASLWVICFCLISCSTRSRSRSRWLKAIRSVSIAPPATYESGHFYFAQTGHSHFAATADYFRLSIGAQRSRVPPILARSSHEPTLSAPAFVSCRGRVSGLRAVRGCRGRAKPEHGADQAVPCHRQGGQESRGQERQHPHLASYAVGRNDYPRRLFPTY